MRSHPHTTAAQLRTGAGRTRLERAMQRGRKLLCAQQRTSTPARLWTPRGQPQLPSPSWCKPASPKVCLHPVRFLTLRQQFPRLAGPERPLPRGSSTIFTSSSVPRLTRDQVLRIDTGDTDSFRTLVSSAALFVSTCTSWCPLWRERPHSTVADALPPGSSRQPGPASRAGAWGLPSPRQDSWPASPSSSSWWTPPALWWTRLCSFLRAQVRGKRVTFQP